MVMSGQLESVSAPQRRILFLCLLLLLIVVSGTLFFVRLDAYPMQNWDEGVHSQVTLEMEQTGDYLTPAYQGEHYFRKPPVKFWITAPLVSLFGPENWVFRFWSALSGVMATVLLAVFVFEKRRSLFQALFAGLFFTGGQFILYHTFRTGEMDGLLVLLITAGLYAYWKGKTRPAWLIGMGAIVGLTVLTKSLAGMIVPFVVCIDVLVRRDWALLKNKYLWYGVVAALAVSLPWHLVMFVMYGKAFWNEYIGFHIVDRTFEQLYADLPGWWYARMFVQRFFPFSILALGGVVTTVVHMIRKKTLDEFFVLLWLVIPFLLYTIIKTKFEWYIAPLYPAAAWLAARFLADVYSNRKHLLYSALGVLSAVLVVGYLPHAIIPGSKTFWFAPIAYLPDGVDGLLVHPWVLAFVSVALVVGLTLVIQRKNHRAIFVLVILFALYVFGFGYGRNIGIVLTQPTDSPYITIAEQLENAGVKQVATFETDFYDKPAAFFEVSRKGISISRAETLDVIDPDAAVISSIPLSSEQFTHILSLDQYYVYLGK